MSRSWFLATPLPDALSAEGKATVAYLRTDAPREDKAARAYRFIYAVGEHALPYHFQEPLAALGVGALTRKALGVALDLGLKGIRTPLRRILNGMDDTQLRGVADAIEFRLYPDPHG